MNDSKTWKQTLGPRVPEAWGREIDIFETQIELRKRGKIEEKLFAETRLRRGAYGQRYDNGQRHDGEKTQALVFPSKDITKGPSTMWDAPGMQRIKIPMGKLGADQLDVLADVAEEYSDRILHVTTRQDFQLHFVHIEDTPDMHRRLAAVGITTREACGNTVRNVTACPFAGVCSDGGVRRDAVRARADVLPAGPRRHAGLRAQVQGRVLGLQGERLRPDQLPRHRAPSRARARSTARPCAASSWSSAAAWARCRRRRSCSTSSCPRRSCCRSRRRCAACSRGSASARTARARASSSWSRSWASRSPSGWCCEERAKLRPDPRWTAFLADLHATDEKPLRPAGPLPAGPLPDGFAAWRETNVVPQRQPGYVMATITLPLGDLTSEQARALADVARKYTGDTMRTTVEQNMLLRWVSEADLPARLRGARGHRPRGAGRRHDQRHHARARAPTPASWASRRRARWRPSWRKQLRASGIDRDPNAKHLHIKASGCFNSCGQHHVADLGFLGVSRNVGGRRVPHFQLVVGGQWENNGGATAWRSAPCRRSACPRSSSG